MADEGSRPHILTVRRTTTDLPNKSRMSDVEEKEMMNRKPPVSPEAALASDVFDQFCAATTLKSILYHHRHLCDILKIKPTNFLQFYPKLKAKLGSWKAQALWNKFDKRASHKCYNRGKACSQSKVLIIGAGPCGLRAAIEAQFLGARVVVVEKRDRITRNNVLHLWPFVIQDLRGLGAKKFFGKFCAGAIDHISIRQLQFILLKVALILGVEVHEGVAFESLIPPPANQDAEKIGWRALVTPRDHPVSQYEFDVLIGADGKRNTLEGFKRKEFRGKLAIAITANFINRRTEAEARVQEISGVAFIFNQKFFKDLYSDTGIDLENIVYYKDDTHYFVMTAKKHSLIDKGVILQDYADTARLLDPANVDKDALLKYAKEAADFSTNYMLPDLDFAVNHHGQPDVAMFDFTSMYAAENASRIIERNGHKLLQLLVGDSLLEPFWPTGSGCARGFLSCMDACWVIKSWTVNGALNPLEVLAERESIYRLLGQTTPENLQKDPLTYTLDPHTRYPNLNTRSVLPLQVRNLFETNDPASMELALAPTTTQEVPKKKRRKDSQVHPDTLLQWLKRQVCLHPDLHVENMTYSFKDGLILSAIISRYRPDLLDYSTLRGDDAAANNQRAFDILEKELGIPPVMTGDEMAECECPDRLTMLSYLSQVYDTFRGEIPHVVHPKHVPESEETEDDYAIANQIKTKFSRNSMGRKRHSGENVSRGDASLRRSRKRRSGAEKLPFVDEDRQKRLDEIEQNRRDRQARRRYLRQMQTEQFKKSLAMMECNQWVPEDSEKGFEDYSLYVYRQTALEFNDRVKDLEMKLLYPDKETRLRAELKSRGTNEPDEDFTGRIKNIEEKLLKGSGTSQKKPKDLLRAIGKIEKTDWNVKEIEKKIEENKYGRTAPHERPEKVPKWSRQHFDDKFQAMERKLLSKGLDQETASRYAEVDMSLKKLEQKLKDGSALEIGQRGSNKVSAMAEQFAPKSDEKIPIVKSASKGAIVLPSQGGSEKCHFCHKRVYLMERVSAEGKFFHRSCFKCEYCGSTLRVGNYMFDKEGKYGNRFYCNQHFGLSGTMKQKLTRNQERAHRLSLAKQKMKSPEKATAGAIINKHLQTPPTADATDRGVTPERIEFENLAEGASDVDEGPSEMDEDEWTDRNFGASAAEFSSDDVLDATDSEEDDQEDLLEEEEALMTADETRKAAERWSRRHSIKSGSFHGSEENGHDSCEADDSDDSDEYSEDEESDTATEGDEENKKALELRKQEVRLQPQRHRQDTDTGSDTEVASDDASSSDSGSEELENSATEISTDSEFEHDGTTPIRHEIPDILITDHLRRNRPCEEAKKVQIKSGNILKTNRSDLKGVKLEFSPLMESKSASVLSKNTLNSVLSKPSPLVNPRKGDYMLSKTQSTEGIATKISLELRKKYLLGNTGSLNPISKSGSATVLDSKLKNFASNISECQKLLNPANEISPSMQAFLQTTQKKSQPTSPTIISPPLNLPPTSMILRKQKELPLNDKDFIHVCGKISQNDKSKMNVLNENVREKNIEAIRKQEDIDNRNEIDDENKENEGVDPGKTEEKQSETPDFRPRSPVYETSILVPQIPWKVQNSSENLSDSLSESETETETSSSENEPKEEGRLKHQPPRLEIRNSRGELMDEEGFEPDSLQGVTNETISQQIELARSKIDELKSCMNKRDSDVEKPVGKIDDGVGYKNEKLESAEERKKIKNLEKVRKNSFSLSLSKDKAMESGIKGNGSCPSSPGSVDESCNTFALLTETELSDWARDGDNCVSEDLEEVENKMNIELNTEKQRSKETKKPKSLNLPGKAYTHICGKTDFPKLLASNENLDFMDMDASEMDSVSATNNVLVQNRGYLRFVNEDELATPLADADNGSLSPTKTMENSSSSSNSKSSSNSSSEGKTAPGARDIDKKENITTDESTTSEQTTIRNSPMYHKNFNVSEKSLYTPLIDMSPIKPMAFETSLPRPKSEILEGNDGYQEYVQNLQGRISPFYNVRDSIDYRKSKQKIVKIDSGGKSKITEADEEKEDSTRTEGDEKKSEEEVIETPDAKTTSKKLEEISRERTLQKDLVHEMVMKKVLPGKKSPAERKNRKITRSSSKLSGSHSTPNGEMKSDDGKTREPGSEKSDVPFVDKTPESQESFHTPATSFRSGSKYSNLPDTPLTNPEAFNIFGDFTFKTPVAPPRDKRLAKEGGPTAATDREKYREDARARARLMSNEELGLSPEEKMNSIREKVSKLLESPKITKTETNPMETPKRSDARGKSNSGIKSDSYLPKSSSTSKVFEKLRGLDKPTLGLKSGQKSTSDLASSSLKDDEGSLLKSPCSPSTSNSSGTKTETEKKRSRDRERRKSIIQAVSDFFHKKSPSPTKSPPPPKPADKFSSKFRLTAKPKDKKDVQSNGENDTSPSPPPVSAPPGFYKAQPFISGTEESAGSECDEVFSLPTPTHGSSASVDASSSKPSRMTKRMARQAQLKRLRIAQEIQRRLEEVEEKQKELEIRGVTLEKALRGETSDENKEEDELLQEWFELVRERNELGRYEKELLVRAQEMELEDRHARLQQELRNVLAKDDCDKSQEEVLQEGALLREMLDTVEKRDALTALLEQERQRYQEEDKDLEAQVLSKGLRLTPIRKYEYQSAV